MQVKTSILINKPPSVVWPLLCSSKMDPAMPCFFRLGIPKPVACALPDGIGGVGARRQCVSTHGVIHQRITFWQEEQILRFQMEDTNLYFRPYVIAIVEEFILAPVKPGRTRLTRTTNISLSGKGQFLKALALFVGMKCVHKYVFKNWCMNDK